LILIDALSSAFWEKRERERERERERNGQGLFVPKVGHALLAVPCRIFMAIRYNLRLI
jgi:hypothetical protein